MKIHAIKAFNDNYIWCLHNAQHCVVVDPGDAQPVLDYCQSQQLTLVGILITHHHWDHTNGLPALLQAFPGIPVFGPHNPKIESINQRLQHRDCITLPELKLELSVLEVPGHTLDHIAYYSPGLLFCGDTLFSAGCGRLFEGSATQMYQSLSQLAALPGDTKVYCTHEYTLANIKFALAVEPNNAALLEYQLWAQQQRSQQLPTLPSTIAKEHTFNPFLRCASVALRSAVKAHDSKTMNDDESVFAALRSWKDQF
ncbi:hydroxyacylglutathione hydrolase [Paraglaciecola hydrolytica]|uniref:Hydroxyacylglutathione hydrolase n=1 Tax=Paraglaciecola hydrolytica TaxID=1799789 RepID=A0A136A592_9ALTE|nr:hydroxyacylglutathione hydrolase [Paraglaciecola hydrolytica]KXI30391.1 hydroxyacylglutathione hydrolase [Paraglaciecola hydrolytica]